VNEFPNATAYRLVNYALGIANADVDMRDLIKWRQGWLQERLAELHAEVADQ
jgi:hypothetical protein